MLYCKRWAEEDSVKTPLERTMEIIKNSLKGIIDCLEFTVESGADYEDGWLPTLDTSLVVNERNSVDYKYYEKPTTTNTTIRMASAMGENPKIQCLSNDLVRRLLNTREDLPASYRAGVVDGYGVKLMTSGFSKDQTRKILMNGMKGYNAKRIKRKARTGGRIHLTAKESSQERNYKKLLGKSSWYKGRRKEDNEQPQYKGMKKGMERSRRAAVLKTRAVIFVEQTPYGELASKLKEQITILEPTLGYRLKVVEKIGMSLRSSFAQTNLWQGLQCGRIECITCNQEGEGAPQCTLSNVTYENICTKCNPSALKKGELKKVETEIPSLYVGETSRSIQERALEHWGDVRRGSSKSHMLKHQSMEHGGEPPQFKFKVVDYHRSALNRQIREAVRIRRRGGASQILNSRSEFNRCHIPRLVVQVEDEESKKTRREQEAEDDELLAKLLLQGDEDWSGRKTLERDLLKKKRSRKNEEEGMEQLEQTGEEGGRKNSKRMRYAVIDELWWESKGEDDDMEMTENGADQGAFVMSSTPMKLHTSRLPSLNTKPSYITDFFKMIPRRNTEGAEELEAMGEQEWFLDDEDWFEEITGTLTAIEEQQDVPTASQDREQSTLAPMGVVEEGELLLERTQSHTEAVEEEEILMGEQQDVTTPPQSEEQSTLAPIGVVEEGELLLDRNQAHTGAGEEEEQFLEFESDDEF